MKSMKQTKICTSCNQEKLLENFYKINRKTNKIRSQCKKCVDKKNKKYYIKNKKIIQQYKKQWSLEHKREKREYDKLYRKKNRARLLKRKNCYHKERKIYDKRFHILSNIRNRINLAIKNRYKSVSTMLLIGCEIDYLMYHIQEQFKSGMSWDNYGDWHIDHIKPCAKFDLSKPEEQRKCFHYSNLQPLWAEENIKKGVL